MLLAFLSHTGINKELVRLVHGKLTNVLSWFDAVDVENGQNIPEKINEGLRHATHFILFWSEGASNSSWVRAELNAAFVQMMNNKCKFMIFTLDNTPLPELLQPYKYESVDCSDLDKASQTIADKIASQEGAISKLSDFINRTKEIGEIEESVRAGYKLIILNGILGIGKSSLAEKAIHWLYPNRATNRIILDFNMIPGIAELSIELSRQTKQPLINSNLTESYQLINIQYFLEWISSSNIILILKDVKNWLDEDGSINSHLKFVTDLIVSTDMFSYATIMTTSRYIEIPYDYYVCCRQLSIKGMDDLHISQIIHNNLPRNFTANEKKDQDFAKRLYGYPLGAKLGAYRIANHGYDYYLEQPQKIQELKVGLAKQLISYVNLSEECVEYLKIVALSQSRLRNEEYVSAFPKLSNSIARLSDEAFFAGILKFDDEGCYKLELLVEDYFYDLAFNSCDRKQLCSSLERYLMIQVNNNANERYMRLIPIAVHILALNGKIKEAMNLRAELITTIIAGMWDQYNHREYDEASKVADYLLSMDASNVEALYLKSLCLTRFDEYEESEKILNTLLQHDEVNCARYYYALGRIYKRKGSYTKAIELFQVATLKKKKYLSPYREMAECFTYIDKISEAKAALKQAKQIDDSNIFITLLEARLLQKEGRADEALELLSNQSMIERDPAQILFRKGRAYDQLGMKDEAKDCYMQALKYNSKTYDAKLCLLNHQIFDNPTIAKQELASLKTELRGKRKYILINIEARFVWYYEQDEKKALDVLESAQKKFIDKQWYAVKLQLLEHLINKHSSAGRVILANEYKTEIEKVKKILEQKYGDNLIVETDLLPDA